jgi:hypothetical protein
MLSGGLNAQIRYLRLGAGRKAVDPNPDDVRPTPQQAGSRVHVRRLRVQQTIRTHLSRLMHSNQRYGKHTISLYIEEEYYYRYARWIRYRYVLDAW